MEGLTVGYIPPQNPPKAEVKEAKPTKAEPPKKSK